MKKRVKLVSVLLVIVLVIMTNASVFASTNTEQQIIDGSILTNDNFSEAVTENLLRGNILNRCVGQIADNGDGSVNVYGAVYGSIVCDKLILELTLQRLEGSSWTNVKSFSYSVTNKTYMTKSYNVYVTSGYYYRVKIVGIAQKNGTSESQTATTNGIWI